MGGSLSTVSGTAEGFTVCAMKETMLEIRTLLFSPQENRVIVLNLILYSELALKCAFSLDWNHLSLPTSVKIFEGNSKIPLIEY